MTKRIQGEMWRFSATTLDGLHYVFRLLRPSSYLPRLEIHAYKTNVDADH